MNIYMIEISSFEAQHARKIIGYSSATGEYEALRGFGFRELSLKDYIKNPPQGQDEWIYTASNAVKCLVYATKI
jgi:hypothetical protein